MRFIEGAKRALYYFNYVIQSKIKTFDIKQLNKTDPYKILYGLLKIVMKIMEHSTSVLFYLFDDIVLLTQLKLLNSHIIGRLKWEHLKNWFALWKNVCHLLTSLLNIHSNNIK